LRRKDVFVDSLSNFQTKKSSKGGCVPLNAKPADTRVESRVPAGIQLLMRIGGAA